jgi:hypothetical protein
MPEQLVRADRDGRFEGRLLHPSGSVVSPALRARQPQIRRGIVFGSPCGARDGFARQVGRGFRPRPPTYRRPMLEPFAVAADG